MASQSPSYANQHWVQWRCTEYHLCFLQWRGCMQDQSGRLSLQATSTMKRLGVMHGSQTSTVIGLAEVPINSSDGRRHNDAKCVSTLVSRNAQYLWHASANRPYFCFFMCGHAARDTINEPRRCTRWIKSQSASLVRAMDRSRRMPALLTTCATNMREGIT